jgi:hypothetical protein
VFTVVPLTRAGTRIGSSFTADIRLEDPTVSRRHALVLRSANGHRILADSGAGLYVNGERVETSPLNHGDEIRVGRHRLYYLTSGGPPNAGTPMVGYDAATLPTQLFQGDDREGYATHNSRRRRLSYATRLHSNDGGLRRRSSPARSRLLVGPLGLASEDCNGTTDACNGMTRHGRVGRQDTIAATGVTVQAATSSSSVAATRVASYRRAYTGRRYVMKGSRANPGVGPLANSRFPRRRATPIGRPSRLTRT